MSLTLEELVKMNLKNQKRMASESLKIGKNRVWIDPERGEDVEEAITREEIRKLIHEGAIKAAPKKGVSRGRTRVIRAKRKKGLKKGMGSRKGKKTARMPRKELWKRRIRAIRAYLKDLRDRRIIQRDIYRRLYLLAKGGTFRDIDHVEQYIESNRLKRRR
jgi:large subunit ribosomal protein L19e